MSEATRGDVRTKVTDALRSMPVRPFRLLRTFVLSALVRVPAFGLVAGLVLFASWRILGRGLGENVIVAIGSWSMALVFFVAGAVLGAVVGLATSAERTLGVAEADLRAWLDRVDRTEGDRLFPAVETGRLREGYDRTVDALFEQSIGRIPMPRFARRLARDRFRRALLEDFLTDCEQRGVTSVGFTEVRDFMVKSALPVVTRPAHMQIRTWTVLAAGLLGACLVAPVAIGLLARSGDPRAILVAICGTAAVLMLGIGLPRAGRHTRPWRYRAGLLVIAGGLVLWPLAWLELWAADIGMAWILVLTATVWTFHRGVRLVLLDADRPRPGVA